MGKTVVVGAGVIGLSIAYELRKRGFDMLVLDKGTPGSGSSLGNAGWIVPSFSAPIPAPGLVGTSLRWMFTRDSPLYINPRMNLERARWLWKFWRNCRPEPYEAGLRAMIDLNRQTFALFGRLAKDGIDCEMRQAGVLFVGLSRDAVDRAHGSMTALEAIGYRLPEILDRDDVRDIEPALSSKVAGGFRIVEERHIRPEGLVNGLVRKLMELGVEIQANVEVTGVRQQQRTITHVQTRDGDLEVDGCIIAAGAWSGKVARQFGFRLPIEAGKGYSITVDAPQSTMTQPMDFLEARTVFTPFEGAYRVAGMMELSGINTRLERDRVVAMWRAANRYFEHKLEGRSKHAWTGLRSLTPDGLPIIGRLSPKDNLYVATGHGMLGVTLAPVTAVALADLIHSGASAIDIDAFSPDRFTHG